MATKAPHNADNSRQARIAEMRRAEQARDRRNKIVAISVTVLILAGLGGFAAYYVNDKADEKAKVKAAAEKLRTAPITDEKSWDAKKLGRNHVTTPVTYPMKPPVGGDHNPVWMNCDGDVYTKAVPDVNAVHSLEHGAVWITYNDKAPKADVEKLAAKVKKTPYTFMSPDEEQSGAIMLSAWGKQVTVDGAGDARVDAFLTKYVTGPQTPEPGAPCTNGLAGQ
ncbi:DUF3105 domain-containing protein [Streptomyces sp. NRRL S-87]|uniref:DUF3105 domain-containing protein n=1 Tax=Streptomyces sp. NRRL S-87 TaxID=1463920 RepID=UPI0004BF3F38|nr:DUF3105 domain-containing protein [Streptomyces sp. NRRL S-87]